MLTKPFSPLLELTEFLSAKTLGAQPKVAVVFDLDSTLFCVSTRTQAILRDLAKDGEFQRKHADAAQVLCEIEVLPTDWGVRGALARTNLQPSPELVEAIREFWKRNFFSNEYLVHDQIYPAANEYVRHLRQLGADIFYLTGRNEILMREGTLKALRSWGFPLTSESRLKMKTSDMETDEGYKAEALLDMIQQHDHVWFFENEPLIITRLRERVPSVRIVYVNSVHSGQAVPPLDLSTIGMSYVDGLPKPFSES